MTGNRVSAPHGKTGAHGKTDVPFYGICKNASWKTWQNDTRNRVTVLCNRWTHHVHSLWHVREEVSNSPVLLNVVLGVRLQCMNHVRKLDAIPDEKDWHVVPDQVPVTLPGVELDSETTGIPQSFWGATLMNVCRKPSNDRCLHTRCAEHICTGQVGDVMGNLHNSAQHVSPRQCCHRH